MNNRAVVVGLMCVSAAATAQSYRPLLSATATWQDENGWENLGPNTYTYECRRYYIDGDSIVDGITYQVLRKSDLDYDPWYLHQFEALLREDTTERRVYIRPAGWPEDQLFYDFSVGVGPYPITYRFDDWDQLTVTAVDTVVLADGPHRRLRFGPIQGIIEGVGYTLGFMGSELTGEHHWMEQLVCHTVADSADYLVWSLDCNCGLNVGMGDRTSNDLQVAPSPAHDGCRLKGGKANARFSLHTMDGRAVGGGICTNEGNAWVDLSDLTPGIYIVSVADKRGPRVIRVIKE